MASFNTSKALLLVDFINETVHPHGKLASKGYVDFELRHGTLDRVQKLLEYARSWQYAVIHVGIGFSPDYKEQPENSLLFGEVKKLEAFKLDSWGTQFHSKVSPVEGEACLTKHRVSAFYGTALDVILRTYGVNSIVVAGCATDLAVQSAIREAHDRDYQCTVVSDCCIAANDKDHEDALRLLSKPSKVVTLQEFVELSAQNHSKQPQS